MIGLERKERLLKHLKEASKFAKKHPALIQKELPDWIWHDCVECCPIRMFFKDLSILIYPHQRNGTVTCRKTGEDKKIYDYDDSFWWKKLSSSTRKSVIKWINERIEHGLL